MSIEPSLQLSGKRCRLRLEQEGQQRRLISSSPRISVALSRVGLLERLRVCRDEAERCGGWRLFDRQEDALRFMADSRRGAAQAQAEEGGAAVHVFSEELTACGARRFIVASYAAFFARYFTLHPKQRHHYEIIHSRERQLAAAAQHSHRSRSSLPRLTAAAAVACASPAACAAACHLYLDIEWARGCNPQLESEQSAEAAMSALIARLQAELRQRLGVECSAGCTLQLDSSSAAKFSRHVVLRIPHCLWTDNQHGQQADAARDGSAPPPAPTDGLRCRCCSRSLRPAPLRLHSTRGRHSASAGCAAGSLRPVRCSACLVH